MSRSLRILSVAPALPPDSPARGRTQYRLSVELPADSEPRIRVANRTDGRALLQWRGDPARHLLQSDALPAAVRRGGHCDCDKSLVRHLTLSCAAAQLALEQIVEAGSSERKRRPAARLRSVQPGERAPDERLAQRLDESGRRLSGPHRLVARTLFARAGEHFSEAEVVCLISLECPSMRTSLIRACLDDLTDWRVIQRIVIDDENVFYDIDLRPHLHIFDPATRSLHDAPQAGVLSVAAPR